MCVTVHSDIRCETQSARPLAYRVHEPVPRANTGRYLRRQDQSDHVPSRRYRQQVRADQQPRTYGPAGVHRILLR